MNDSPGAIVLLALLEANRNVQLAGDILSQ